MQKCPYSAKSMQQIGQLQHLGKIQRQVKPCHAEKPWKTAQQRPAMLGPPAAPCKRPHVHRELRTSRQYCLENRNQRNQRNRSKFKDVQSLSFRWARWHSVSHEKTFSLLCGANVGLHSLRATDPLESSEEPARKRRQMREECEDPASSV